MKTPFSVIACIIALGSLVSSAAVPYVVHEDRKVEAPGWKPKTLKIDYGAVIPLSIALTQSNLENGHSYLLDVSDPLSPNYGKHWTSQKIIDTFAASETAIMAVRSWIVKNGIAEERVKLSRSRTWINANVTVREAEWLLRTRYQVFEHKGIGKRSLACDEYSVPVDIQEHIDFISPTIQFNANFKGTDNGEESIIRASHPPLFGAVKKSPAQNRRAVNPEADFQLTPNGTNFPFWDLSICDQAVTLECVRALYHMPNGTLNLSSFGVYETGIFTYNSNDLEIFFSTLDPRIPPSTQPVVDSIDGGVVRPNSSLPIAFNTEPNLDLSLAIGLTYPQTVTNYQVGDLIEGGAFDNFLDALDASYCTYDGGDPSFDPQYPDPYPGGYKSKDCGGHRATHVISMSSSVDEALYPASAMIRECHEYMKLGLRGITFLDSSGDSGVAGRNGACCINPGCVPTANGTIISGTTNGTIGKTFTPHFPDSCPYITSVGATMIRAGASVRDPEVAAMRVSNGYSSGGGFSNVFPMPEYQRDALDSYFNRHLPPYTSEQYNNSRKARGIPDISANGLNISIVLGGNWVLVGGTSASTPIVGSLITLVNEQRIKAGKGPVGFINPVLYATPWALNDIVEGSNPGCGTNGFEAVKGWDPVTGLGTPDFEKLLKVWMALP